MTHYSKKYPEKWLPFLSLLSICTLLGALKTARSAPPLPEETPLSPQVREEMQEALKTLPGGVVSLDFVMGKSIASSDSFQEVRSQLKSIFAPALVSRASLDTVLSAGVSHTNDQTERVGNFAAEETTSQVFKLGAKTTFRTGTTLEAELGNEYTEILYPSTSSFLTNIKQYESYASVTVTQSLLKNSFGSAARLGLEAGDLEVQAAQDAFQNAVEQWSMGIVEIFYNAWRAQAEAKAAQNTLKRRKRLHRITQIKASRGTAERPDVLQVESSLMNSQIQLSRATQALRDTWRQLVTTLKLPTSWLQFDPSLIPIQLDSHIVGSLEACGRLEQLNPMPKNTAFVRSLQAQAQAADLKLQQAQINLRPDLSVFGKLKVNGVDTQRGESASQASSLDNRAWTVGVNFSFPLMNYAQEADLANQRAQRDSKEAKASGELGALESAWMNDCTALHRWRKIVSTQIQKHEFQNERLQLEEQRFRTGQVPLTAVIQAGDDANQAELDLRDSEKQLRMVAWRVKRLTGGLAQYVQKIEENLQASRSQDKPSENPESEVE